MKPTKNFKACIDGAVYPQEFTPDDEFEANSAAAKAALDLGCLTEEDAELVKSTLEGADHDADDATEDDEGSDAKATKTKTAKAKSEAGAPENKSGGAED